MCILKTFKNFFFGRWVFFFFFFFFFFFLVISKRAAVDVYRTCSASVFVWVRFGSVTHLPVLLLTWRYEGAGQEDEQQRGGAEDDGGQHL